MKAILEMDAPKSCAECRFISKWGHPIRDGMEYICLAMTMIERRVVPSPTKERAPFCPLKIVKIVKEGDNDESDNI